MLDTGHVRHGHIPLVESTRGAIVESVHYGSLAVVSAAGTPILSAGAPNAPVYARSALKPLQLVAMIRAGLDLPDELLALGASSHSGAAAHQAGAERILALHGLDPAVLRNVADLPAGGPERDAWLRAGGRPTRLAQNCSGKHAAMASTCVINGWPVDDYLDPAHPLQRLIEATIAEFTGENATAASIDGCGSPVFAYSLSGIARAYARLGASSPNSAQGRVVAAMRRHPDMVAGDGRDVTRLMRAVPGLVAKEGAEAVQAVGLPDGIGIAVKVADGGDRARLPITIGILGMLGVDRTLLANLTCPATLGGGRPVGGLRVAETLFDNFRTSSIESAL